MPTPPDDPCHYHERLPQVQRSFHLHRDRIDIDARWTLGRSFRSSVKLADLSPQARRFTVRNKWFKRAVMVGAIALGLALLCARHPWFSRVRWATLLCWPVAGVSLVVAIRSFRKRQFVHFPRTNGKQGVDICRMDPEAFEAFVREVQARIRKA